LAIDLGDEGKSPATRIIYKAFLGRWVKPAWGSLNIRGVRTTAVEHWLRQLVRADGNPMAPSTKAKIRNLMSTLFNHAIRYEWLEQGRNPILLVRQSAKRQKIPECLEPEELRALLSQLDGRFRVMVFLDAASGLRRSELLALKWGDIDFDELQINVRAFDLSKCRWQLQDRGFSETCTYGFSPCFCALVLEARQPLRTR
jgi:integrase